MTIAILCLLAGAIILAGAALTDTIGYKLVRSAGRGRLLALTIAATGLYRRWRNDLTERRRRRRLTPVERLLEDQAQLQAPDELYRAPEPTKAMRRRFTRRAHPIARKKSGRHI